MLTSAKNESVKFRDDREIYQCTRKRQGCTRKRHASGRGQPSQFCACTHFVQRIQITPHRTSAEERDFGQCLHDSLLCDRIMLGVKAPALRKMVLEERQVTLKKAIDICNRGETTAQQLKDFAAATDPNTNEIHALKHWSEKKPKRCQKV